MIRAGAGHDREGNYTLPPMASLPGEPERDSHHFSAELSDPSPLWQQKNRQNLHNTCIAQKRKAAGVPAWNGNGTEKHSSEIHKWISDNTRMRMSPVALALMLTEWPAEVKGGFVKKMYYGALVRSLLGRSDSLSPHSNRKYRFNSSSACSQNCANWGDWIKGRQWMILSVKTTQREIVHVIANLTLGVTHTSTGVFRF